MGQQMLLCPREEEHLTAWGGAGLPLCLDTGPFSSLCRAMQVGPWHVKNPQGSGF